MSAMWHSLWNDASALNRIAAVLALVTIALIGMVAMKNVAARPEFAIRSVVVTGKLLNADPAHIASVVHHDLRGTFFTIDVGSARDALQRVAWVRRVSVRREWPARIEIAIEEHQPLARWNDGALVSTRGDVFRAPYEGFLPRFKGPEGAAAQMVRELPAIRAAIEPLASAVTEIRLSPRGAWQVGLESGLTLDLGRGDIHPRLVRFIAAWPQLAAQGAETKHADLRYANGFAMQRK